MLLPFISSVDCKIGELVSTSVFSHQVIREAYFRNMADSSFPTLCNSQWVLFALRITCKLPLVYRVTLWTLSISSLFISSPIPASFTDQKFSNFLVLSLLPVPPQDVPLILEPLFILPADFTLTKTQVSDQFLLFHARSSAHGAILRKGGTLGGGAKGRK